MLLYITGSSKSRNTADSPAFGHLPCIFVIELSGPLGCGLGSTLNNMEVLFIQVPETAKEESFGRKGEGPFPLDKVNRLKAFISPR